MKKALAMFTLAAVTASYSFGAHALFTRCDFTTSTRSAGLIFEVGGGEGQATCWDVAGNKFTSEFNVGLVSAGIQGGICQVETAFQAVGVGFSFAQLLAGMAQIDLGSKLIAQKTGGVAVKLSPLGVNADVSLVASEYSGPCFGIVDLQGLVAVQKPVFKRAK